MMQKRVGKPSLSIIVPVYNEEDSIGPFIEAMRKVLPQASEGYEIIFINDGSRDKTLEKLYKLAMQDSHVKVLGLSRNFGKEAALTAGLDHATGDAIIPMDVDLQDPPELIVQMVEKWQEGFDVVLATRKARLGDGFLKRVTAGMFYGLIGKLSNVEIPANTGDFRLMDARVLEALKQLPERTRFMKGIFAWVGFSTTQLYFERGARVAGKSSLNFPRLWKLAMDGIFSFTTLPLRIWTTIGALISGCALLYALFIIAKTLMLGVDVPGYASLMTVVLFMGGIQLLSIGVIGEYVGRIYRETKQRPIYLLQHKLGFREDE